MLRPYLARPQPILAHLRRHACRPPVGQLSSPADRIHSRSYKSASSGDDTDDDQPVAPAHAYRSHRRQHLYVVLEDWNKGFSIHKFDLDDPSDAGGDLALRPPVHRQEKQQHGSWNFAVLGSKIVAAGCLNYEDDFATIVYDTETAGLSIAPRLPIELYGPWTLAAGMGNSLYVFEPGMQSTRWTGRCTVPSGMYYRSDDAPKPGYHETYWSWTSIPAEPPFNISGTESSALHPDALFVSAAQWERNPAYRNREPEDLLKLGNREKSFTLVDYFTYKPSTFSYDAGRDELRRLGEWELPFYGRAHYNAVLDVWVGLHMAPSRYMPDGYVCACDVVPPDECPTQPPNWKLSTERLFDPDAERHLSATLVHTGDMNYCLVEVIERQTFMRERSVLAGNKCTVRLSTFRLQYSKNGELTVTAPRSERSYRFSRFDSSERVKVHAFSM